MNIERLHQNLAYPNLGPKPQKIAALVLGVMLAALGLCLGAHAQTVPLANIQKVVAGSDHTCALTQSGGVKCWGRNDYGQLGDDSIGSRLAPVDVVELASGVTALAAGHDHTCALTSAGGVKCWGSNGYGQLGDNSMTNRLTPVEVVGLTSGVTALAAGSIHTCALTNGGGVKCWGGNFEGQLGDNSSTRRLTPVEVIGLASGITAIAAGWEHTCALTNSGGVKCWGWNGYGQLGDNSTTDRRTPVEVIGLASGVTTIGAGRLHTCALTSGGGVKCWGWNRYGQLGDNSWTDHLTPVDVAGLASGVTALAAGWYHTCALTSGGGVKCWGQNQYGQLGDNGTATRLTPGEVTGLTSGVVAIAAGYAHTCALTGGGGVKCWGWNEYGQLGDNGNSYRGAPVDVVGLASGVTALAAGWYHACALTSGGGIKCWGQNEYGQLGDNSFGYRLTPVEVAELTSGVIGLAAGHDHTCALISGGGVKCWGRNDYGQLGDDTYVHRLTPVNVTGLASGVTAIAAGYGHTCALTSSGGVKCWGWNYYGQLGDNSGTQSPIPVDVAGLTSGVTALTAGWKHTCALTSGGGVTCWGANSYGQLGNNSTTGRSTPVEVVGLASGVIAIAAGDYHTCALTSGGGIKCWGWNDYGQLGDDSRTDRHTPVDVAGLASRVTALATGYAHTCAVTSEGSVKCWGWNQDGQLGDNSRTDHLPPVEVVGLASGVTAISAGYARTCALTNNGGVKCWGSNDYGQLGDGTNSWRPFPADVVVVGLAAWEFYNSTLQHYFITASQTEAQGIDQGAAGPGWSRTGQSFYAYPLDSTAEGLSSVCRFYGTPGVGPNSHFYTANAGECEWVKTDPGWFYEGLVFRIATPTGGTCTAGNIPVYRLYNGRWRENDSNHRYTTESGIYQQMQTQGWAGEGVVFCAAP